MHPTANNSNNSETKHSVAQSALPTKHDEELHQTISAMLQKEEHYACRPDWLERGSGSSRTANKSRTKKQRIPGGGGSGGSVGSGSGSSSAIIDASCRAKVCRWIFRTVAHAGMSRETAMIAMSYLDRFLWSKKTSRRTKAQQLRMERARRDRREYQLVAMTSLYVAIKIHESSIEMDARTMSRLSRGFHSAQDILSCEREMLPCLQWKMNGPTSYQFIHYILELLPDATDLNAALKLYAGSRRQVELSVQDHVFVPIKRSTVAVAAMLNSLDEIDSIDFSSEERAEFLQRLFESFDLEEDCPLLRLVRKRLLHISHLSSRCQRSQSPRRVDRIRDCASPSCISSF
mmetsp:Transcript_30592/g.52235  ORF Transcript_30592/g.52235 Transcript_30592/m.52235 type:complete len:346 (+) Transcript_30592:257-1294(+)